jgi:endonuclease G
MFYFQPILQVMKRLASLLLLLASAAQAQPFGSPACHGEPADRLFLFLCHSPDRKVPLWTAYTLTPDLLDGSAPRPRRFRQDLLLAASGASDRDYLHSGYSRGHLAPAVDFAFSDAAIGSTFLLSNAIPQRQSVNAGRWRQVEIAVRRIARHADRVHIFTGVLFEGEQRTIGAGGVSVPSHTYKVILVERGLERKMYAVIVPNQDHVRETIDQLAVSVDEVEQRTGLDFFSELPDAQEHELESPRQSLHFSVSWR